MQSVVVTLGGARATPVYHNDEDDIDYGDEDVYEGEEGEKEIQVTLTGKRTRGRGFNKDVIRKQRVRV